MAVKDIHVDLIKSMSFTPLGTGGEYAHKLNINELPSHNHMQTFPDGTTPNQNFNVLRLKKENGTQSGGTSYSDWSETGLGDAVCTSRTGNDISHNNIMPYIVSFFWKRIK